MSTGLANRTMGRKKTEVKTDVDITKIHSDVMRDARILVALTGEGLSDYLSRVLRPIVAKDKADAMAKEQKPKR